MKRLQPKPKIRHEVKFSSKGISKGQITAPMTIYRRVLRTERAGCGSIQGFRARSNRIDIYEQARNGFSYFYCKRRVLDDGMSTIPLDLELCPAPKETEEEENETDDSSEEDLGEHIDDATLKQWMENQFESEDEMS